MSPDSGCPCPDIRWQEPQAARATPASPFTIPGAGPCSSGNQSGGFALLAALAGSYSLLLPGTWTGPVASTPGGCTLSGMLYAQEGRPLGIVCDTSTAEANANIKARGRTLIQLLINSRSQRLACLAEARRSRAKAGG